MKKTTLLLSRPLRGSKILTSFTFSKSWVGLLSLLFCLQMAAPQLSAQNPSAYVEWSTFKGRTEQTMVSVENGEAYVFGRSRRNDFPVTAGAAQSTFGGDLDLVLTKFDANGNTLYATYLGGSGGEEPVGL
ncbi:MAG TPA: hypothetical protein VJ953_14730, partial [Saprospiraceae bacterium]|nr:hypothetical protein [Saprospiraceae bacterium]